MKIGIIGAGHIGGTIARKLVAAGHSIKLAAAKGPDDIREKAEAIGAVPVTSQEAVQDVEVIVLSIPFAKVPEVAGLFADVPPEVVVIDTSNYYPQFGTRIPEVEQGMPETVWSSEQLGRPVVKTFNAALAKTLADGGKGRGEAGRFAMPVAGDDEAAKSVAQQLVDAAGFDPLDAGALADSWRQQPGTPAYCTELTIDELKTALASAVKEDAPRQRDALMAEFASAKTPPSHETVIARNREVTAPAHRARTDGRLNVGVIGSGNIGSTLARKLQALGHTVLIANSRGPATLAALAAETGAVAATVEQAAQARDLVIIAIPQLAIADLPHEVLRANPAVVVDAGNYYPTRDGVVAEVEAGAADSEWIASVLGRPVIKAFNNIVAHSLATRGVPSGTAKRVALSVAGDDAKAKKLVQSLVEELGFDALDGGTLAASWRQQPGTPAYCKDLNAVQLKAALASADQAEIKRYRKEADEAAAPYLKPFEA